MAHAFLPPSGASAWSKCALWPTMNRKYPQDSSPESLEGDAAHWVAWERLAGRKWPVGTVTPNNLTVTDEMADGAELLLEAVGTDLKLHIEEWLQTPIHPECSGTPDIWANTGHTKRVFLWDYKFGHRFVDEYFNPQMLTYLSGILLAIYGQIESLDRDIEINLTVIQPRCFYKGQPVRTHTFKLGEALGKFKELRDAAEAAMLPNPIATTNPNCDYCSGRHSCSALQQAAYSDAEFATDRIPLELSPEAAGLELRMLQRAYDRLGARVDGLREQTLATIKSGKRVPFFHVEQGVGRSQWIKPDNEVIAIGQLYGVDLSKPGVVTPAQAKKLGVDESVTKAYSITPATAHKLVADNPADIRKVFGSN